MIKLYLARGLGFYFCGSIALFPAEHTQSNPKQLKLEDLTDSEVLGLERGVEAGAIAVLEGEDLLKSKVNVIKGIVVPKVEEAKKEVTETTEVAADNSETSNEYQEDTTEDSTTKTPRKRTTRKTTTTGK